jgi:hypothetical protein
VFVACVSFANILGERVYPDNAYLNCITTHHVYKAMNKALVFAGIAVAVISKVIVLKSILIDSPIYQRCVSNGSSSVAEVCGGIDPFVYFILGWFVTVGGFILLIFGLRMPTTRRSISR